MSNINDCCITMVNDEVEWEAVRYFVKAMIKANIQTERIIEVSQTMVELFNFKSELEVETVVRKCIDCQQGKQK